jgi:hypothetical protein
MDSPKLRRHAPRRRERTTYESRGGKGSKQPRLLPPSPVAQNSSSPESIPRNGTGRGGIKRSCGRQGDTRHNSSPLNLHSSPHLTSRPPVPPIPKGPNHHARGTATTTHAAHSETASRGGADGEAEALTPVVEKVRSHSHRRARWERAGHWSASPPSSGDGDGRGREEQGKAKPPGPRPQKGGHRLRRRRGGGNGGVGWGAYGRSPAENISGDGRGVGEVPPSLTPCCPRVQGGRGPWARLPQWFPFGTTGQRVDDDLRGCDLPNGDYSSARCLVKNGKVVSFFRKTGKKKRWELCVN